MNKAERDLTEMEELLHNNGWKLQENNGVLEWQQGGDGLDKENRQHVFNTLIDIQQTGAISGELELRKRAGAIARALRFGNLAKAFSKPNDEYFDPNYMPDEMRKKTLSYAVGDGRESRPDEESRALWNLSQVSKQTYEDVENEPKVEQTLANIKTNGWPLYDNLGLRAQINDRVVQRLVSDKYFDKRGVIDLSNTAITDEGLKSLAKLMKLELLHLRDYPGITDDAVIQLRQRLPEVTIYT